MPCFYEFQKEPFSCKMGSCCWVFHCSTDDMTGEESVTESNIEHWTKRWRYSSAKPSKAISVPLLSHLLGWNRTTVWFRTTSIWSFASEWLQTWSLTFDDRIDKVLPYLGDYSFKNYNQWTSMLQYSCLGEVQLVWGRNNRLPSLPSLMHSWHETSGNLWN